MSASHLCFDCIPEGTQTERFGFMAGPPPHCHGKNDKITPGVIGGYSCSCECNQRQAPTPTELPGIFPPTQHLVMEVLAARHRLGEAFWPFPQNCIRAIKALEEIGLVHIMKRHDVVGWIRVRLTDKGIAEWGLNKDYRGVDR